MLLVCILVEVAAIRVQIIQHDEVVLPRVPAPGVLHDIVELMIDSCLSSMTYHQAIVSVTNTKVLISGSLEYLSK